MKITFDSCIAEFGDISIGEAFLYNGHFYLKVLNKDDVNVVDIANGHLSFIEPDTTVTPIVSEFKVYRNS